MGSQASLASTRFTRNLGRAPMQNSARAKARDAYHDFFTLLKDADPDISHPGRS
jgi:hypothetical protein